MSRQEDSRLLAAQQPVCPKHLSPDVALCLRIETSKDIVGHQDGPLRVKCSCKCLHHSISMAVHGREGWSAYHAMSLAATQRQSLAPNQGQVTVLELLEIMVQSAGSDDGRVPCLIKAPVCGAYNVLPNRSIDEPRHLGAIGSSLCCSLQLADGMELAQDAEEKHRLARADLARDDGQGRGRNRKRQVPENGLLAVFDAKGHVFGLYHRGLTAAPSRERDGVVWLYSLLAGRTTAALVDKGFDSLKAAKTANKRGNRRNEMRERA